VPNRPTLLNACARAATAAEARFRIDGAPRVPRCIRVVSLDPVASAVLRPLTDQPWPGTRFLRYDHGCAPVSGDDGGLADLVLGARDGSRVRLSEELADADFLMMVATGDGGARVASAIGNACALRGVMTAGVVLGGGHAAVSALRPHARVLLVTSDAQDVADVLSALGA
jgi:hypothetical protein